MAVVEHHTWAPPRAIAAQPPSVEDKKAFAKKIGVDSIGYSDFISGGRWNVDDVLRPIYEEAGRALGREFEYPGEE